MSTRLLHLRGDHLATERYRPIDPQDPNPVPTDAEGRFVTWEALVGAGAGSHEGEDQGTPTPSAHPPPTDGSVDLYSARHLPFQTVTIARFPFG